MRNTFKEYQPPEWTYEDFLHGCNYDPYQDDCYFSGPESHFNIIDSCCSLAELSWPNDIKYLPEFLEYMMDQEHVRAVFWCGSNKKDITRLKEVGFQEVWDFPSCHNGHYPVKMLVFKGKF